MGWVGWECGGEKVGNKANLSPAEAGAWLSLAINYSLSRVQKMECLFWEGDDIFFFFREAAKNHFLMGA